MGQFDPQNTNYSIYGHWACVFGQNSAIFWPIGLKLFMGTQEIIIYRLVIRTNDFDVFEEKKLCLAGNGHGCHTGAKGFGASRPDQKVGLSVGTFGSTVI